jgi:lipopolysaccharide assembly outer membrane protein LptD (OstA)
MTETDPRTVVQGGFAPIVSAETVEIHSAGAAAVVAGGDVAVHNAGAQMVVARGDVSIANGGAQTILASGGVQVHQGGAAVMVGGHVEVQRGFVGIALAPRITMSETKLILGPSGALALGVGLAFGAGLVRRLFG